MTIFRAFVAFATAVSLIATFGARLSVAADDDLSGMRKLPELGDPTTEAMPPPGDLSGAGKAIAGLPADRVVQTMKGVNAATDPTLRGKVEEGIYARHARSVVLIVTPRSLGSGTVVDKDGTIATNWHVVRNLDKVGVIFKPANADVKVRESDAVEARIVRIDQIADLALIKVTSLPADIVPVALADLSKLAVGADVHAIGHPFGETWSYTKGIVSQIRSDYAWTTDIGVKHRADVVQTQTPINPGNSGGPLLNDAGELVGINAFGDKAGSNINFAVAATELRRLLAATADRLAPEAQTVAVTPAGKQCEPAALWTRRSKKNDATIQAIDIDCDGKMDAALIVPDDEKEAIVLGTDLDANGTLETLYVDRNRDGKFDEVHYDTNDDGKTDLIGYDLDENLEPRRVVLVES